jgi:hypothetical protein
MLTGSVSPTPTDKKGRARSTDSTRKSRIDHQHQQLQTACRQSVTPTSVSAARSIVQPASLPQSSSVAVVASSRVKSSPMRPSQLAGVVPHVGGPPARTPSRPLRTPSPKTLAMSAGKPTEKPNQRAIVSPQKPLVPQPAKMSSNKVAVETSIGKPPLPASNKVGTNCVFHGSVCYVSTVMLSGLTSHCLLWLVSLPFTHCVGSSEHFGNFHSV